MAFGYVASEPGAAVLTIRKGRKLIATVKGTIRKAGRGTLTWNGKPKVKRKLVKPAPGQYAISFSFTAAGRTVRDTARLTLRR